MTDEAPPSYHRRRLALRLRQLREGAQLTQEQTAKAMEWSISKVIRIESAEVSISVTDLRALLTLYHLVDEDAIDELLSTARASRGRRSWATPYQDRLDRVYLSYIEYEPFGSHVRYFQDLLLPGLLQTADYARACLMGARQRITAATRTPAPVDVELGVAVRMRRQSDFFAKPTPPELSVVLDESTLRRVIGGTATMRAQLAHLLQMSERDRLHILVFPFANGYLPWPSGQFILIDFADPLSPSLVFREIVAERMEVEARKETVDVYRSAFEMLASRSLDEQRSRALIDALMKTF